MGEGEAPTPAGEDVLGDLPVPLWGALLRAVRRATGKVDRSELAPVLRPFADWKPERLADERPRRAIASALVADVRLRESVGEHLEPPDAYAAAESGDPARLTAAYGEATAAAALASRGRWDALAVLGAEAAGRLAARERASAEASARREAGATESLTRRLSEEAAALRAERDALRRRADAADAGQRRLQDEQSRLRDDLAVALHRAETAETELAAARRQQAAMLERWRRRLEKAQAQARVDEGRVAEVAAQLHDLADGLRAAVVPGLGDPGAGTPRGQTESPRSSRPEPLPVPRGVKAAAAGRPAALPPGVGQDEALAVRALLQVDGLTVLVDGYNVTKDVRGRPHAALEDQRKWLIRLVAGLAAQFGRRFLVVFDGSEPQPGVGGLARGVAVIFTQGEETADERIVSLVEALDADAPALVVTSDREVRTACLALGANVAASRALLEAAGA